MSISLFSVWIPSSFSYRWWKIYSEQLPVLNQDVQKSSAESKIGHKYPDPSPFPQSTALISSLDCGSSSRHSQMPRTCSLCHQEINFTGKGAQLVTDCKALWKWKTKYSVSASFCYHSEGKKPSAGLSLWLFVTGIQKNLARKAGRAISNRTEENEEVPLRTLALFCKVSDPQPILRPWLY